MTYDDHDSDNPYAAPQVETPIAVNADSRGPEGIGGWLILPMLGLIFSPIASLVGLMTQNIPAFTEGHFARLTNPASPNYHPLWAPLLILEPIGTITIGVMAVFGLVLMFRKSRSFPRFMIILYSVTMAYAIVDSLLAYQIPLVVAQGSPQLLGQVARACLVAAIWIPYMRVSKRVKNTFVN